MDEATLYALKAVVAKTRLLMGEKYGHRKRLSLSEVGDKAVLIRDITTLENWIEKAENKFYTVRDCPRVQFIRQNLRMNGGEWKNMRLEKKRKKYVRT